MGEVMKKGVFLAKDLAAIVCPVEGSNPGRVAQTVRTKMTVVLPIAGKKPKTSMTYFTVFPEQSESGNYGPQPEPGTSNRNKEPEMRLTSGIGQRPKTRYSLLLLSSLIVLLSSTKP